MKEKKSKDKKASPKTSTTSFLKKFLSTSTVVPTTKTTDGSTLQYDNPRVSDLRVSQTTTVAKSLDSHKPSSFEPHFDKQNPKTNLSKGEIIAITLGAVIGVTIIVLLLAIAVILYKRSKPVSNTKPELVQETPKPVHRPPAPFPRNDEPNVYEYIKESDVLDYQRDIADRDRDVYNIPGESNVSVDKHNYGTFHDATGVGPIMEETDLKTPASTAAIAGQTMSSTEEHVYLVLEPP